jgi:hypothetical protein
MSSLNKIHEKQSKVLSLSLSCSPIAASCFIFSLFFTLTIYIECIAECAHCQQQHPIALSCLYYLMLIHRRENLWAAIAQLNHRMDATQIKVKSDLFFLFPRVKK